MSTSSLYRLELVNCVQQTTQDKLEQAVRELDLHVLRLNGARISDGASFLAQAEHDLPMLPDLRPHNWDAFADIMGRVLRELEHERIAIVWTDVQQLLHANLHDFVSALLCLTDLARDTYTQAAEEGATKAVYIFLVGDGPEFTPFA